MPRTLAVIIAASFATQLQAELHKDMRDFIETSCIQCHDADTETELNLKTLGSDLADSTVFRQWERVYDRVRAGEMPPTTEPQPTPADRRAATERLQRHLMEYSRQQQRRTGRVPARRLSKLELGYTLQDLLFIDDHVTSGIPDEVEAGSFDTVGATQRISAVHIESYLQAAEQALHAALQFGRNPYTSIETDFSWLEEWHEKPINLGGSVTRKLDRGIALFADIDYLTGFQFNVQVAGIYRLISEVGAIQTKKPVTLKLIVKEPSGGARLVHMADLPPDELQSIEVETLMKPGDKAYLTFHTEQTQGETYGALVAAGGAKNYRGKGIAIQSQKVEGPLYKGWPPQSSRQILEGLSIYPLSDLGDFDKEIQLNQIANMVHHLGPRIFRRPVPAAELQPFIHLAEGALAERRHTESVLIALRAMLTSPHFLMFGGEPGQLDDFALANRLSYFLWKSLPDDELFVLAKTETLAGEKTLAAQVERMLNDEKSVRFVKDFLGQWLRLNKVNATSPDEKLYPEFDEVLSNSLTQETELFFAELLTQNLSLTNLIESDFTFLNRRLAEHYGIKGVEGQHFRRFTLPTDSPRGGVLTHAAVLKTTANGTTTSPVMRGNFVLTNLLGTPPSLPPPSVGSIEPDTRGKTTIREILAAHRNMKTCAKCHREIDPPGFALECFDPIGGFRKYYRATGGGVFSSLTQSTYHLGPPVDMRGTTSKGDTFDGIDEYKQLLLGQIEQIARHFVSVLVTYSTGGEIQFADREEIEAILDRTRDHGFRMRDIIHEVVQSRLFREK